jgi:hypothetical protein
LKLFLSITFLFSEEGSELFLNYFLAFPLKARLAFPAHCCHYFVPLGILKERRSSLWEASSGGEDQKTAKEKALAPCELILVK